MSTSAKTPSPLMRSLRSIQLGLALGLAAFLLGTLIQSRMTFALLGALEVGGSGLGHALIGLVVYALPTLLVAPLIAFAAGLYFEGGRGLFGWALAVGTQLFPPAISGVVGGWSELFDPAAVALFVGTTVASGLLCSLAFGRGQRLASVRSAAEPAAQPENALSKIDFEAVKKAAEAQSAAPAAVEAAPAETAAAEAAPAETKTGS